MASSIFYEVSPEKYDVKKYIESFKDQFEPILIKVVDNSEGCSLYKGLDICVVTDIKHQQRIVVKCDQGQYMSIPVTHPLKFKIATETGILPKEYSVRELLAKVGDFPMIVPCFHGQQGILLSKTLPNRMEVVNTFEEKLLVGYTISSDTNTVSESMVLPLRCPLKFRLVTGMVYGRLQDHMERLLKQCDTQCDHLKEYEDIMVYKGDVNKDSDYTSCAKIDVYSMLKFWREKKCTPPMQNDRCCDSLPYTTKEKRHYYVNVKDTTKPAIPMAQSCQSLIPTMNQNANSKPMTRKSELSIVLRGPSVEPQTDPKHTDPIYVNLGRKLILEKLDSVPLKQDTGNVDIKSETECKCQLECECKYPVRYESESKYPVESESETEYNVECEKSKYHRDLYEKGISMMKVLRKIQKETDHKTNSSALKCTSCKKGSMHVKLYKSLKQTLSEIGHLYGNDSSLSSSSSDEYDEVFYDANDRKLKKQSLSFKEYCERNNLENVCCFNNEYSNDEIESNIPKYITMKRIMIPSYIEEISEPCSNRKPHTIDGRISDNGNSEICPEPLSPTFPTSKTFPIDVQVKSIDQSTVDNSKGLSAKERTKESVKETHKQHQRSQVTTALLRDKGSLVEDKIYGETVLQTLESMLTSTDQTCTESNKTRSRKISYNSVYVNEIENLERLLEVGNRVSTKFALTRQRSRTTESLLNSESSSDEVTDASSINRENTNPFATKSDTEDETTPLLPIATNNSCKASSPTISIPMNPFLRKFSEPSNMQLESNRKKRRSVSKEREPFIRRSKSYPRQSSSDDEFIQSKHADRKCKFYDQEGLKLKLIGELEEYNDAKKSNDAIKSDPDEKGAVTDKKGVVANKKGAVKKDKAVKDKKVKDVTSRKKKKDSKFHIFPFWSRKSESVSIKK